MLRFGVLGVEWLLNADMAASATRALWSRDSFMRGVNPDNLVALGHLGEEPALNSHRLRIQAMKQVGKKEYRGRVYG